MKRAGRKPSPRAGRPALRARRPLCTLALAALAGGAGAQSALTLVPSVGVTLTATDNRDLSSSRPQSDLIAELRPGIALASRRGPLQGALNYSLSALAYARDSDLNTVYHNLDANGRWALLDGRAGIEARAGAGRQIVSAFGTQSVDAHRATGNQAQVRSYSLSPYLNGVLAGQMAYQARLSYSDSRSDIKGGSGNNSGSGSNADTASLNAVISLNGRLGPLGWGLSANRSIHKTATTARAHNGGITTSLNYQPDPELQGMLRLGTEVDDMRTGRSERVWTWGLGAVWTPTPRTLLRADYDRRFFGRSHALMFSHRMARTLWTLGDARSFQTGGVGGRAIVSAYDLFFAQFASVEPDPAKRDALVRNFLVANGIDPTSQVAIGGFLTSGPTVQRTQNASLAYQGLRTTVMLTLLRSRTQGLGASSSGNASLAAGIAQETLSVTLSHRLTPQSSLLVAASQQRTPDAGAQRGNDLQTLTATWSTRLGEDTNASLGLRYTRADGARPYDESALIGTLRMQF